MTRFIAAALVIASLAGCVSDAERCAAMGAGPGSPNHYQCMSDMEQRRQAALNEFSASLRQQQQNMQSQRVYVVPPPPRPQQFNCYTYGPNTQCTSW
jgi:hypothetical protein